MKINPTIETYLVQNQVKTDKFQEKSDFRNILTDQLQRINNLQIRSDKENQKLVVGESEDVASVLLATEEARLSLELAVQIRNKLIEAYQEINRIQL